MYETSEVRLILQNNISVQDVQEAIFVHLASLAQW